MELVEIYQSYTKTNDSMMYFIEQIINSDFKNSSSEEILERLTNAKELFESLMNESSELEAEASNETNLKDLKYLLVDGYFLMNDLIRFYQAGEIGRFKMRVLNHFNKRRRAGLFKERPKHTVFLFDFDYTLADSEKAIVMCFRHVLNAHHIENISDEAIKKTIGIVLIDGFRTLVQTEDEAYLEQLEKEYIAIADEIMVPNTKLYKETIPMLKRINAAGYKVGIISSKFRYRIESTLELEGITDLVDLIIGKEDVLQAKPDPQGIYKAMAHFESSKEEILYVGDSYIDAEAAQNAGVDFAAVLTGTTTRETFERYPHIQIMESLDEVLR